MTVTIAHPITLDGTSYTPGQVVTLDTSSERRLVVAGFAKYTSGDPTAVAQPATGPLLAPAYAPGAPLAARRWDAARSLFNFRPANTRRLRAGIARATYGGAVGSNNASGHLIVGESTSDSFAGSDGYAPQKMWPAIMRDIIGGNSDGFIRCGAVYPLAAGITGSGPVDSRWALTGTYEATAADNASALAGLNSDNPHAYTLLQAGATGTCTPAKVFSGVDVWYLGNSSPFTISVDGATSGAKFLSVTPSGNVTWEKSTITGMTLTNHTVKITCSGATVLRGVSVYSTAGGLALYNFAEGGTRASDWATNSNILTLMSGVQAMVPTYAVDCLHIATGINSLGAGATIASVIANITTIRSKYPAADVILHGQVAPSSIPAAQWEAYLSALYTLAHTLDCPLVDLNDRWGGYAGAAAVYLMGDGAHPALSAQRDWGNLLAGIISR